MIRHFLADTDFPLPEAAAILENARALKRGRNQPSSPRPLAGQTWAMIFHKSSTRTRISFEVGVHELGGHPMYLDTGRMQMGRGETVADTARVMGRYVHGIIIRTFEHALIEEFARESGVPVVNALTDLLHPCQIATDIFTLAERWAPNGPLAPSVRGRKVAFLGDCASNMAHSWILGAALFGIELRLSGPKAYAPEVEHITRFLKTAGLQPTWSFTEDPAAACEGVDCVYTDVWVSMGDEAEKEKRLRELQPWQVNLPLFNRAAPDAYFLHCLPAHEGEEVSTEVYQHPRSIVYDQAENRLHVQKAILARLAQR